MGNLIAYGSNLVNGGGGSSTATGVSYDNTTSELESTNVQDAIDELKDMIGGGGTVPDGKTVTPINDITILQQCAGIANPTYTTLSEILADSGVLSTIISSTNAIDYLVRSKMFAGVGLVPTMTSDTTPSGECFGSSYRDSSYAYFKAFDNDSSTSWVPASNATNNAVGYNFGTKTKVTKFRMVSRRITVHADTFTVQGSDDNFVSDIHDLVSFTQEANSQGGEYDEIKSISGNYKSYRVFCPTVLYLASNYGVQTKEIQFYSENICDNATAMSYIGLNNYASNTLLADSTWCSAICNSAYFESVLNVKVPVMTSNTTPSGEVSAQSYYSGREPYLAFDGNSSTRWNGSTVVSAGQSISEWIKYKFTQRVSIKRLSYNYNSANTTLIIIEGSNDNSTFREVARCSNVSQGGYTYAFTNPDDYQYYRLTQTQTNNTTGSVALPTVIEIQLYGRVDV